MEVRAAGIRADSASETHFLVLEDTTAERRVLVAIGPFEAAAIALAQQQVAVKRPMTHGALKQTVDALGAHLARVVVDHQPETSTFTADVVLTVNNGDELHLDWRVSDSVALAVRLRSNAAHPRPRAIGRRTTGESDHRLVGRGAVRVLGLDPGARRRPPARRRVGRRTDRGRRRVPVLRATETLPH